MTRGEAGLDGLAPEEAGPLREAEERESACQFGVETVVFLDQPDGMVEYGLPLRRELTRVIRRLRPEVLLTCGFDLAWPSGHLNQADHRAVGLAALDAARDAGNRWIFRELLDEGIEPLRGLRYVFVQGVSDPDHACPLDPSDLDRGIDSLAAQRTYFEHLGGEFDPAVYLTTQATEAGRLAGLERAVTFRLYLV